jgi:DoxX-like family
VSETMKLHHVPEATTLHPALWTGRIMSAFVVIALAADGTIQLVAPAQIASMLRETGFAMEVTRVVGPIILACAILYAIPATAILGAILVTGFLGGAICAHVRIGELGSPPELISLLLGVMTWGGLYARDPRIRAILPLIRSPGAERYRSTTIRQSGNRPWSRRTTSAQSVGPRDFKQ